MVDDLDLAGLGILVALHADSLTGSFACACVGAGALTAHGETAAVTDAAIAVDGLKALEVGLQFAAEITFNENLAAGDGVDNLTELFVRKVLSTDVGVHVGKLEDAFDVLPADSINVGKRSFDTLLAGNFDTE